MGGDLRVSYHMLSKWHTLPPEAATVQQLAAVEEFNIKRPWTPSKACERTSSFRNLNQKAKDKNLR